MGGPVDGDFGEVQAHDAVKGPQRLFDRILEDAGLDPFVAARPQRRVRDHPTQQALGGLRGTARHQPHQDPLETHPIRRPAAVTTQRVGIGPLRQPRLGCRPRRIFHFLIQRAHNEPASTG